MAATVRPRGPLPPRVYWTRRLLVIGVPLLLVVVLARFLGGSADGKAGDAANQARQAGARTASTTTSTGPVVGPSAPDPGEARKAARKAARLAQQPPPEPVPAEPTGPCDNADVTVTPVLTEAAGGADVPITLNLRTLVAEACTWQASPDTLTVTITSGDDRIWSSRECPASIAVQDVVVRQGVDTPVVVTWDEARRSDETCSDFAEWAMPGWYHVQAAALGGGEADAQFELVAPSPAVVTKTVEPKGKGGDRKRHRQGQQDTTHEAGEDGGGNSAG